MLGHTGDVIARLVAWTFLPDFITRQLVKFLYRGQAGPAAYRRTLALVIAAYLAYNIFQASVSTPPNLYQILGVPTSADEGQLKTAFRNFARRNHPDRAGPKAEPLFIMVRDAYDGLKHPVKRFAYDRFGPDIFKWDNCATPRDYVNSGLLASCGFYIGSTFFMMVFWLFSAPDSGSYWRYLLFFGLLVSELALVLAPSYGATSGILGSLFPHRVPYQHVLYLHQLFLSISIAISRIVPALAPDIDPSGASNAPLNPQALAELTEKVAGFARSVEVETYRMMLADLRVLHIAAGKMDASEDFSPASLNDGLLTTLQRSLEELIVDRSLRSHPLLKQQWEAAVARHREAEGDEEDEVDVGDVTEQLPSPPSSEQPESPSPRLKQPPRFEAGAFNLKGELQSSLGLKFPGTPGARLRGRSTSV